LCMDKPCHHEQRRPKGYGNHVLNCALHALFLSLARRLSAFIGLQSPYQPLKVGSEERYHVVFKRVFKQVELGDDATVYSGL
jgi:hypothetical protein